MPLVSESVPNIFPCRWTACSFAKSWSMESEVNHPQP
eukprot:CAMPEP_0172738750 /NCGR_PEP_ID=MMETSP1074-20121228/120914_1 /TAXON_ID=2916 /ORGANISM="Ceratium fusus, Strain PA161109" /LENGTH=36 /DNA_ID= /DNA_START= /DNA_END= /DNA_ORIENTATION=